MGDIAPASRRKDGGEPRRMPTQLGRGSYVPKSFRHLMATPYQNTISGLLQKRSELMREAGAIKERLSVIGNDVQAIDRTLETLGFKGKHETTVTRGNRVVLFQQGELRRACLDVLRKADKPLTSRQIAERIIQLEGNDPQDRRLSIDMIKRVGKSLKLLGGLGLASSARDASGCFVWGLTRN